ncbi:hypothetical protein PCYB_133250 [Plasmodium cynomolgi strain B]|uniref:Protein HGH1 N-terminal domain-containing protein n=1 Tax=Plasmodium cynomolgi (strain B) TaxID=1120755 RepID=K6UEJ3_PLACD|nr:hypothetical protein PCYB_133250 [Plasmodium cynomolgi strain B]GAB68451.1 hypothetical protein PCYB_133250 [Plasmodium cynomolgi strain B]
MEEEVNEGKKEGDKGGSEDNDTLYDELFSLVCSDKDIVKREAFKILLGLIDNESMVAYIKNNEKKCLKILISALNSNYEVVALQCLVNLSAHIPKELIQRNLIEIVFDILRDEEETEAKGHTEMYIMLVANLSREKAGIYKILDLPEEKQKGEVQTEEKAKKAEQEERNELAVSYYLNKLLHLFSKPIVTASINKQITDKYFFIAHILINVSSVKECVEFFKSVFLLNMLGKQMLQQDRCAAVLQCVINLCLSEVLHPYVFHEDCYLIPRVLSLVYTREKASGEEFLNLSSIATSQKGTNKDPVHQLILDICDISHLADMYTEITPGCIYIE